jgi:hypothetical protein
VTLFPRNHDVEALIINCLERFILEKAHKGGFRSGGTVYIKTCLKGQ